MTPTEILREILARTDNGPGACVGADMTGYLRWKSGFASLLSEARQAIPTDREANGAIPDCYSPYGGQNTCVGYMAGAGSAVGDVH